MIIKSVLRNRQVIRNSRLILIKDLKTRSICKFAVLWKVFQKLKFWFFFSALSASARGDWRSKMA